jgi:flagellar biosynthetic protein FliQ
MTTFDLIALLQRTLVVTLAVGGPIVLATLAVGLAVAVLQAATQINEATLTFLPKLLVVAAVLVLLGPGMLTTLVDFTRTVFLVAAEVGR